MLTDVRAIERGESLAAALCGKYLAALGADVLLERADRFRGFPSSELQGKNFLSLYLDAGKQVPSDDPSHLDIILNADLSDPRDPAQPGTIRVGFSEFGDVGPLSSWESSELVAQAVTGMMEIVAETRGGTPLALAGHQVDYSTGLIAFSAVMIALWARDGVNGSGLGQDISVSRYETGTYIEWKGRIYDQVGSRLERGNTGGPLVVKVQDGYFGLFFDQTQYFAVADYLGDPRLREERFATRSSRADHEAELLEVFTEDLRDRTRQELYEAFQAMGMAVAPVLTSSDLLESPQYLHRGFIVGNPTAGENAREPGLPATFNRVRPGALVPVDVARKAASK